MNQDIRNQLQQKLESEKQRLEQELKNFAVKDKTIKDNWKTKPLNTEWGMKEEVSDEAGDYENLLSVEESLEVKLRDVNNALEKIKKGSYGMCERCGKEIEEERLMAYPEAKTCVAHQE